MSRNQALNSKFDTTGRQSGEVTAALSIIDQPSAIEAYKRIQAVECSAVAAATARETAVKAAAQAAVELEVIRKHVRLLNAACVNICGIRGVVSAEYFTVVDRGDDAGLALRLEPEIRSVPGYGPALADGLAQLLGNLTAAEAASQKARATVTACQRDLDAAIFGLQSVVAQGRAVLASFGVKLTRKKAKKKVEAKVEQPAPQPETMPIAA